MNTTAIVRQPGKNFANGITTSSLGAPDYKMAILQHTAYIEALQKCGLKVIILPPDERYPDGCFVEDTAVITDEFAIITRPGDERRRGEELQITEVLKDYKELYYLRAPSRLDGGDVVKVDRSFYIGESQRTNKEGILQFTAIANEFGYQCSSVPVGQALHLKSSVAYLGDQRIIISTVMESYFKRYDQVLVDPTEEYACNCLKINDHLLIPSGYPNTKEKLLSLDYQIIELDTSEFRKMDGGLTCLSLLF